jgi:hypothetical protein
MAQVLVTLINSERLANGLPALTVRTDLTSIAQAHSRRMADAGTIWHNDDLFTSAARHRLGARALGENVGLDRGNGAAVTTHQMYMGSPPHRANILDPRFTAVGVAITMRDGNAYSTEDFLQASTAPAPAPTPAPKPAPPKPAPAATPPAGAVASVTPAAPPTTEAAPPTTVASPRPTRRAKAAPTTPPSSGGGVGTGESAAPDLTTGAARGAGPGTGGATPTIPAPAAVALGLVNAGLAVAALLVRRRTLA